MNGYCFKAASLSPVTKPDLLDKLHCIQCSAMPLTLSTVQKVNSASTSINLQHTGTNIRSIYEPWVGAAATQPPANPSCALHAWHAPAQQATTSAADASCTTARLTSSRQVTRLISGLG
jgi:hypothetical protein